MDKQQAIDTAGKAADIAWPIGFATWFISHIKEINEILQTCLLVASIFATLAAGLYHLRKRRLLNRRNADHDG